MSTYRDWFFEIVRYSSRRSAGVTVPIVIELLQPRSVVDIGCATGEWLATFRAHGVERIRGLDGGYVSPSHFAIPADSFTPVDLAGPFSLHETFDLAMSLEVAEHLPTESARGFVASLVRLAPVILFSAATPGQGGVNHINCQWPEYWAELFAGHDYAAIDCLRDRVWENPEVAPWYAQNMLLFAAKSVLHTNLLLSCEAEHARERPLARAHPGLRWWKRTPRLIRDMLRAGLIRRATRN